jgi:hypothetical protein
VGRQGKVVMVLVHRQGCTGAKPRRHAGNAMQR